MPSVNFLLSFMKLLIRNEFSRLNILALISVFTDPALSVKKNQEKFAEKHVDISYHLLLVLMVPVLVSDCFCFQRWCLHCFFLTDSVIYFEK